MTALATTTDLCRVLSDGTRVRLLALLQAEELTVAELVQATRLAQPRVSSHLGRLRDAGLVADRRQGAHAFYRLTAPAAESPQASILGAVLGTGADPLLADDAARLEQVLAARAGAQGWADTVAGQMARHYSPGRTWPALSFGLIGLMRLGKVLDIASGDGAVARFLAPRAQHITCLDLSDRVVAQGQARSSGVENIGFVRGDMHELPFGNAAFGHVLMLSSLSFSAHPAAALAEAARVLQPGGTLVATTLLAHPHADQVARFGHQNQGFAADELAALARSAGLQVDLCRPLGRERRAPHFASLCLYAHLPGA